MAEERKQTMKTLEKALQNLSEEKRQAIFWIIQHIQIVEWLTDGEKMPQAELQLWIQEAIHKKDNVLLALALYQKFKDQNKPD